jgi:protease-4
MSEPLKSETGATIPGWERSVLEKVALAAVREQRAARRWRIFFRLVWLGIIVAVIWGSRFGMTRDASPAVGRHTALVTLTGEIAANTRGSARYIDESLDRAFGDADTAGVILSIDSPGGSPVQAGIIYDHIRVLRARHPAKPLYVVVGDICASGGYYVAAAADKVFVNKASLVGSIGVRMDSFGFTGLMDKLGIERRLHTAGANKGFYDPFSPEDARQEAHAQELLDEIHQQFITAVRQGRGTRLKETPETFSGMVWTGQRSVTMGLADGFGDVNYVAAEVIKADKVVDYTVKENIADRIARRFGASLGGGAIGALLGESGLR